MRSAQAVRARLYGVTLIAVAPLILACPKEQLQVVVTRDAGMSNPLTRVHHRGADQKAFTRVTQLDMETCETASGTPGEFIWRVRRRENVAASALTDTFLYGAVPPGFSVILKPRPLIPGCYAVSVFGDAGEIGGMTFQIDVSGHVTPRQRVH